MCAASRNLSPPNFTNGIKWFFKVNGGIAGSARKYAINRKAARRKNDAGQNNIIHRQCGLGEIPKLNAAASDGLNP
jgi:hypothetical protein